MICAITGASSYLGYNTVKKLLSAGACVHALVRPSTDRTRLEALTGNLKIHEVVWEPESLARLFTMENIDTVLHFAAFGKLVHNIEQSRHIFEANLWVGSSVLEAMAFSSARNFVAAGSYWQFDEAGNDAPNSLYAATKSAFDTLVNYYADVRGIRAASLYFYDIYGPGDWRAKLIPLLLDGLDGAPLEIVDPNAIVAPLYISDAVDAIGIAYDRLAAGDGKCRDRFFVGAGEVVSVRQLVDRFEAKSGSRLNIRWGDVPDTQGLRPFPCRPVPPLPGWSPKVVLETGLKNVIASRNREGAQA